MTGTMTFAGLDVHARWTQAAAIDVLIGELRRARFGAGSLPDPAGHVPLDRDPDQGDRPQPALGRRVVRRARARLPAPLGGRAARLPRDRLDHLLAAGVPVRRPVRALDGLPRLYPPARPRGDRQRHVERRGRPPRDRAHSSAPRASSTSSRRGSAPPSRSCSTRRSSVQSCCRLR
jgi:hypothetical protein